MELGTKLWPQWNNEACSTCNNNHRFGYIKNLCPYLYNGKCFVEQVNIIAKTKYCIIPSTILDIIIKYFPNVKAINNIGSTELYIKQYNTLFYVKKDYTQSYRLITYEKS